MDISQLIEHAKTYPQPPHPPSQALYTLTTTPFFFVVREGCCTFINTHRPLKINEWSNLYHCWDLLIRSFIWRTGFTGEQRLSATFWNICGLRMPSGILGPFGQEMPKKRQEFIRFGPLLHWTEQSKPIPPQKSADQESESEYFY